MKRFTMIFAMILILVSCTKPNTETPVSLDPPEQVHVEEESSTVDAHPLPVKKTEHFVRFPRSQS